MRQICFESISENERMILRPTGAYFDFLDGLAGGFRMAREHGLIGEGGRHRSAIAPLYLILVTNIQDEVTEIRDWRHESGVVQKDFEFKVQSSMFKVSGPYFEL